MLEIRCGRCAQTKPVDQFHRSTKFGKRSSQPRYAARDYRASYCKSCAYAAQLEQKARNPEYYNEYSRRRYRERSEMVDVLKNRPCADCGVQYPPVAMDFDHLGEKTFSIGLMKGKCSMEKLAAEIAKCEVVCANCHRIRTHARKHYTQRKEAAA
jgi:hypothetical protein